VIAALSALMIVTAIGVIAYWVDFYTRGTVHVVEDEWYIKFERAFPPADLWMAACALAGAAGLLMEQSYGVVFALLAAGSLIFLALMDITFGVQNGLYRLVRTSREMKSELFINLWTLGFGTALIVCLWSKTALV
jgi:hypothetical protein